MLSHNDMHCLYSSAVSTLKTEHELKNLSLSFGTEILILESTLQGSHTRLTVHSPNILVVIKWRMRLARHKACVGEMSDT